MVIRDETAADRAAITGVTQRAFASHAFSRQTEHFIIRALRAADALTVSLVAEREGAVVGHIAFSPVTVSDGRAGWYGMGPVSVSPECQRQGIGSRLVEAGLTRLKALKAAGCLLVGDPAFYRRFGFESPQGLGHEGVPPENFMILAFDGSTPQGQVQFHPAFGATD